MVKDEEGSKYAIKKVCLDPDYKNRELDLVIRFHHPNILHYVDHYSTNEGSDNMEFLHLVTDYFPESLPNFLSQFPFPPPIYVKLFGFQIFAGLCYLHKFGICHRDIKPSNVLVDHETGYLQICDFGSAKFLKKGEESVSYIATRSYRAPELLLDCSNYTTAVDIWAAGCVLSEMYLHGRPLFSGENWLKMMGNICQVLGTPKKDDLQSFEHKKKFTNIIPSPTGLKNIFPNYVPSDFVDLVSKIFVFNPKKRMSAAQCLKHPFFVDIFDPDAKLPTGQSLPEYLNNIRSDSLIYSNYPTGPTDKH